jgi:hypothetical protein
MDLADARIRTADPFITREVQGCTVPPAPAFSGQIIPLFMRDFGESPLCAWSPVFSVVTA